jgi:hypothetical protein
VNQPLREELRILGYDARVGEIRGLLQEKLEDLYREYVIAEVGSDIYYDPKKVQKSDIALRYREPSMARSTAPIRSRLAGAIRVEFRSSSAEPRSSAHLGASQPGDRARSE